MFHVARGYLHKIILKDQSGFTLPNVGFQNFGVLSPRVLGARFNILGKGAVGKKVVDEVLCAFRPHKNGRLFAVTNPGGQQEVGKVDYVVIVKMRQEDGVHIDRVDVRLDHGASCIGTAVKQIVSPTYFEEDS